jgi:uncharacterized protein (DUF2336 family)
MSEETYVGLDVTVLSAVLEEGDVDARIILAKQLALLLANEDTPFLEREQVIPIILKLTVDKAREVRAVLAAELMTESKLHADIVFSIIADDDDISLPFLAQTPALNAWHMMAVLRVGDEERQATVAARGDITTEAAIYIIKSSPLKTVVALFDNKAVQLESDDYQTLYTRFGQAPEIVERLLARSDLPLDIRITQAKRTGSRMRQLMAEKGWVAANDATEFVADAEEAAILRILIDAEPIERARATSFLAAKNMLTPALIVRSASMGEMSVVETALAHLSGNTPTRAAEMMYSRSTLSFKSIFNKSGLPQTCFGILKAACEVRVEAKEEGLPLDSESFGRRVLEALMTRYESMGAADRAKQIEYLGRYGQDRIRKIAKRLKADLVRAA